MKKVWIILGAILLLGISLTVSDQFKESSQNEDNSGRGPSGSPSPTSTHAETASATTSVDSRISRLASGQVEYIPALTTSRSFASSPTPRHSLALVQQLISHYRFAYQENPVGVENFEITEQLLGKNPKNIVFIASNSAALRGNELVDQWGTPYFFHALSGTQMEIRSAGPDQTLWTSDDIHSNEQPSK